MSLKKFSKKLEDVCIKILENGTMTKDLALVDHKSGLPQSTI